MNCLFRTLGMILGLIILGVVIFFFGWIVLVIVGILAVIGLISLAVKTFL